MWSPNPEPETLNRRIFLSLAVAGAGGLALPYAWDALTGGDDEDDPGRSAGRPLQVYGGTDNNRSRKRILQVWGGRPRVRARGLTAEYRPVGDRSTDQIDHVRNVLAADPGSADLLVIDAEYLPGLVAAGQVAEFAGRDRDWLLNDLGCIATVAARCVERDKVYAVPLNTDVPMLVFDDSRVTDRKALAGLGKRRGSDFWIAALALAQNRLLLQNGEYEGFTACLTELIAAFGRTGGQSWSMPGGDALTGVLDEIKQHFPAVLFDPDGTGDEETTFNAFQDGKAVAARMWPSQCHNLTRQVPGGEANAASYTVVPIPGGVLGGQVIAVGKDSTLRQESQELAVYLAEAASQLQLNYNGGYVPTIGELYLDDQLRNDLYGVDDKQIDASTRRPVRTDYLQWSDAFREDTRKYLLSR